MSEGKKEILLGDCLELMKDIPNGSIDMILCDLPYGTTQCKWDSIIDLPKLWEQYERVIKPNGAIVLTAAQPFTSILVMSNLKLFKYDWVWKKPKGTGHLNAKKQPMRDKEFTKKGLFSSVKIDYSYDNLGLIKTLNLWKFTIIYNNQMFVVEDFSSPEEAELACLKKLIEIVKK